MSSSVKKCKVSGEKFNISDKDKEFYKKINVPFPSLCPDERMRRRAAFRNDKNFYKRKCDLCGEEMITIYSKDKPYPVYCNKCFWSDKWDALEYGKDFDFSKPFFEQFGELQKKVPRMGMFQTQNVNSDYTVHTSRNKNCYMCDSIIDCEDVLYSSWVFPAKDCVDCTKCEKIEKCYWCTDCINCYNSAFLELCSAVSDSYMCFDCRNCNNTIGCVGLRHKKNMILNQKVSAAKVEETRKKLKISKNFRDEFKSKYKKLLREIPKKYMWGRNFINCTGNYVDNSKDSDHVFEASNIEDSKFVTQSAHEKDSYDIHQAGWGELLYEIQASVELSFSKFCNLCYHSSNLEYCDNIQSSENCFGCISLKRNKFCILNKQYSEDEYHKLVAKIIDHMKKTKEYGEFFPIRLSAFAYNETAAQLYYPLNEIEAEKRDYIWKKPKEKELKIQKYKIPENIGEVTDDILDEILVCSECGENFKIIRQELLFYRNMGVPVPDKCYKCRHKERILNRTKWELYKRKCNNCGKEIETSYSKKQPYKIYCGDCYNKMIY